MRLFLALALTLAFALQAHASSALYGSWSGAIDGQPLTVTFNPNGSGKVNDKPMQWQTLGKLLFVQKQGESPQSYSFEVKGEKLSVGGGDLNGIVTLSRGTAAAEAAAKTAKANPPASQGSSGGSGGQELVGKWCKGSNFTANSGGGSSRMACIELKPDGSYTYRSEGSMSANAPGMWGGTSSQSGDAGRWTVAGNQITAQSRSGKVSTYSLEKRNNPKNKRDPMICLDGDCYTTYYNRQPW
jgi:hypothetical protein